MEGWRFSSLLPNAISWTDVEWPKHRSLVICVKGIAKPAFWNEGFGITEVVLGSIGGIVVDSYCGLEGLVSIIIS